MRDRTVGGGLVGDRPVDDVVVPGGVAEAEVEKLAPVHFRVEDLSFTIYCTYCC